MRLNTIGQRLFGTQFSIAQILTPTDFYRFEQELDNDGELQERN